MGFINSFFLWLGSLFAPIAEAKESVVDSVDKHLDSWSKYDSYFKAAASKYGIDWQVMKAISVIESDVGRAKSVAHGILNPYDVEKSKSWDGKSWGIMQVTLPTARALDSSLRGLSDAQVAAKLNNVVFSIDLSAKLIRENMDVFSRGDSRWLEWVVKSYNQGAPNTLREKAGNGKNYTGDYWPKFKKAYDKVRGL